MSDLDSIHMEHENDVKTPTSSQETKLLNAVDPTNLNKESVILVSDDEPVAKLSDIKRIVDANARSSDGELTFSLHSGEVIANKPSHSRNRNRQSKKRNEAKKAKSLANPHERVKAENFPDQSPLKRPRTAGDTPPSATQKPKKFNSAEMDTPDVVEVQENDAGPTSGPAHSTANPADRSNGSMDAKLKRNERRKRAKLLKKQQLASLNSVETGKETPLQQNTESSGSSHSTTEGIKQTVPPGTEQHLAPTDADDDGAHATYAAVLNNLCMAIIDQRQQGQMQVLTQERVDKITTLLTNVMLGQSDSNADLPVFEDTRLHSGAMRVRCANDYTRLWLMEHVPKLQSKQLWSGAKLIVMDFKDIPKPHKFNVLIRNVTKAPKDIFRLLELQNKDISTKSWTVISNTRKDNNTLMTIGVGQDSFEVLHTRSNSLFCGMGKAIFTIVKGCKENKALLQRGGTVKPIAQKADIQMDNQSGEKSSSPHVEQMETGEIPDQSNSATGVASDNQ